MPLIVGEQGVGDSVVCGNSSLQDKHPAFDPTNVIVFCILGGPGAGKGTECAYLVKDFGFCHVSTGDLLRAEQQRSGSTYGDMIRSYIKEGRLVPTEVVVKLVENAIRDALNENRKGDGWGNGRGRFLVDGFPREMDQVIMFEEQVCPSSMVLFFETTEEVMLKRILERGTTSGREDDNEEIIKKRFCVYKEQTIPVIEYYRQHGKVTLIDSTASPEEVHERTKVIVADAFIELASSFGHFGTPLPHSPAPPNLFNTGPNPPGR